jgi:hypothetical protein
MLQSHNAEVLVKSIDQINQMVNKATYKSSFPFYLLEARDAIHSILLEKDEKKAFIKLMDNKTQKVLDSSYKNVPKPKR